MHLVDAHPGDEERAFVMANIRHDDRTRPSYFCPYSVDAICGNGDGKLMKNDDCLRSAREEMVRIESYARDAALRLGIPDAIVTWGDGWPLSRAVKIYPMRIESGEVSQAIDLTLDGLSDYPGRRPVVVCQADVDQLLEVVRGYLDRSDTYPAKCPSHLPAVGYGNEPVGDFKIST
jgi:hypothetical protein